MKQGVGNTMRCQEDQNMNKMGKNKPGYLITLEGSEGCGKSSQIPDLAEYLRSKGLDVLTTREPGGTFIGDQIRQVILRPDNVGMNPGTETLLFQAARAQIINEVIRPNLEQGVVIICDRFADCTLAYQGYGHGQDLDIIKSLVNYATSGLTPDLTIFMDVDIKTGLERKLKGKNLEWTRLDASEIGFFERIVHGYRELAKQEPERWITIDANESIEKVQLELRTKITERLIVDGLLEGRNRGVER